MDDIQSSSPLAILPGDVIELLHCLGYIYLRAGQPNRAVILLLLAARHAPSPKPLCALALALIECGHGASALAVLARLNEIDSHTAQDPCVAVMRARALLADGQTDAARAQFAASRRAPHCDRPPSPAETHK